MLGILTNLIYVLVAAITAPRWLRKARGGWAERFGRIGLPPPGWAADNRPVVLVHAVSVGEAGALRALVPLLTPHARVVVSATTDTGLARARDLYGETCRVVRYPLDATFAVRRFLDAVEPDVVALTELELWPNFVSACRRRGVPIAIVNGRISERSFRGYMKIRPLLRRSFAALSAVGAQDEGFARRFVALGVPEDRVRVAGSLKWDSARDPAPGGLSAKAEALAAELGIDRSRLLVVAGSTAPGEEHLLHLACDGLLLVAPRRPERFDEVAASLPRSVRRSARTPGQGASRFVLDSLGELGFAYELADVVVMGRSFGDRGGSLQGSDPMEPAALGKPVLIGPAHANFARVVQQLEASGGLRVVEANGVRAAVGALLADDDARKAMGVAARRCVEEHRGASAANAEMLLSLVHTRSSAGP
ncbi:MAG: glycosyltransferase N-terminal domain-containing protein [Planctomycetota bacterium]